MHRGCDGCIEGEGPEGRNQRGLAWLKKAKIAIGVLVLLIVLTVLVFLNTSKPQDNDTIASSSLITEPENSGEIVAYADLDNITKHGNIILENKKRLQATDMNAAGIEEGDTALVRFLDKEMEVPVVENYSEIKAGDNLIRISPDAVLLCTNLGDFASTYIADKTTKDDGSSVWTYKDGVEGPVTFRISLAEKGGAAALNSLSYTDNREDYPNLTDEQFANFRMISTTGVGEGTLFRTCSPVDPAHNRNTYADAAIENAGVRTILNLSDTKQAVEAFPGYANSYYATTNYLCLDMEISANSDGFKTKLAKGLRFIAEHEGPYALHCLEGKDRTGIVAALLECFMGANLKEVEDDYMLTFYNYYGVEPGTKDYEDVVSNNIHRALQEILGTQDLENANLSQLAEGYFRSIGLTDSEIEALRAHLSESYAALAELPAAA